MSFQEEKNNGNKVRVSHIWLRSAFNSIVIEPPEIAPGLIVKIDPLVKTDCSIVEMVHEIKE